VRVDRLPENPIGTSGSSVRHSGVRDARTSPGSASTAAISSSTMALTKARDLTAKHPACFRGLTNEERDTKRFFKLHWPSRREEVEADIPEKTG
jgi:hypothetical protein